MIHSEVLYGMIRTLPACLSLRLSFQPCKAFSLHRPSFSPSPSPSPSISLHLSSPLLQTVTPETESLNRVLAMAENVEEWNGVYDAFSDPEEKRVLFAALDSFR